MRNSIALFICIAFALNTGASDMKFYNINSIYGTSIRKVASICKDDNGFVWGASKMGILRVTEGDCRIYQLPYKTTDIYSVKLTYGHSCLYAYTSNGQIFLYDEITDKFVQYSDLREIINSKYMTIHQMIAGSNGALWIASSGGIYQYKNDSLLLVEEERKWTQVIIQYDDKHLIYATNKGIKFLNTITLESEYIHTNESGREIQVSAFFYDRQLDRLWIGTFSEGLHYLDIEAKQYNEVSVLNFPKHPIRAIEKYTDSSFLVGIDGKGIWELNRTGETMLNVYKENNDNPSSLQGNGVYDIFYSENNRIWVATYSGGLSFFEKPLTYFNHITHKINNPNSLRNDNVNRILEDRSGNIWFATDNGISRWKKESDKWDIYYQDKQNNAQVFLSLCEDDEGNIWAGSYSSGLYVLNGKTGKEMKHFFPENAFSGFIGKHVFDVFKDSQGDIWIGGTQGSVLCYLMKEKRFRTYSNQPVYSFSEVAPGKILASCSYGLFLFDKDSGDVNSILTGYIIHDCLIVNNEYWLATSGDGLIRYNSETRQITKFNTGSGLSSNYINSIILSDGHLMLGTESGLCKFNIENCTAQTYPSVFPFSQLSYNQSACCQLKSGELAWGTNNGAIIFEPGMLFESNLNGRIFFQNINVSGRSIREIPELARVPVDKQKTLRLKYTQNTVSVELLPIDIATSYFQFSWKMEGIDSDWSTPSSRRTATYASLPNGNFIFKVRMYDNALSQVIDERSLKIRIIPPFWETWWFRLITIILIAGIILTALKYYINHLKQLHAEDKIRFFTNIAHDIRTSLTLINAPIEKLNKERNLSTDGHYYLNLATEQSKKLTLVTTQLLDIQKVDIGKGQLFLTMADVVKLVHHRILMFEAAAAKNQIELIYSAGKDSFTTAVDEIKIEKIVDNLLSNAIKYSFPGSKVEVILICNEKEWNLSVKDYGLGISENAQKKIFREFYRGDNTVNSRIVGTGIGLLLTKNYVSMHQGKISFESKVNAGTLFRIEIPYKMVHETNVTPSRPEKCTSLSLSDVAVSSASPSITENSDRFKNKKHLLLVEDNIDLLEFVKHSFQEQYIISTAADGKIAWKQINAKAPDLIISDVMMPNMDGFELCQLLKSTFETSHIPIILLTALSDKTYELEGLGLGADDYITKPFDISILAQRIKSIVRNREIIKDKALALSGKTTEYQQPIFANELNDKFVKKAIEVVKQNMDNCDFSKEEFSREMCVSTSLLYKKLMALTGQSPINFITAIRLNYAMELLKSNKYTITEISELCGFSRAAYFSMVFKKNFGKTPTELMN